METLLISLILLLVLILVGVMVQEIATNASLPLREQLSFIAEVIGCPPFGIFLPLFQAKEAEK